MLKLYHSDMSVCSQKVRLVLAHKHLPYQHKHFNLRAGEHFNADFLKISPKALVPVLVHDGQIIPDSNVIMQYLEEVFPEHPLMPQNPVERARLRSWLTRLDAGLHEQVVVLSFCIAFRHQILERNPTEEALENFLKAIPDPGRKAIMTDIVSNGLASPRLEIAVLAYNNLIKDLAAGLDDNDWIIGNDRSLADYAFLPYIERLQQLQLGGWWAKYPQIDNWLRRVRKTNAYQQAMLEWHNPGYIKLMAELGAEAWPKMSAMASC